MILNLTQHKATKEQVQAGVSNLPEHLHERLKQILTFNDLPTTEDIKQRAYSVTELLYEYATGVKLKWEGIDDSILKRSLKNKGVEAVMIGGAPFFMSALEDELLNYTTPLHAFSRREVAEKVGENGEVVKTSVFKHVGFVNPPEV